MTGPPLSRHDLDALEGRKVVALERIADAAEQLAHALKKPSASEAAEQFRRGVAKGVEDDLRRRQGG